jgi:hypothetical protein
MHALNGRPMLPSFFSHVENGAVGVLDVVVELHDRFCPVEFLPDVVVPSWLACDEVDQGLGSFAGALAPGLEGIVAKDAKSPMSRGGVRLPIGSRTRTTSGRKKSSFTCVTYRGHRLNNWFGTD